MKHRHFTAIGNRIQKGPNSIYKKPRTSTGYLFDCMSIRYSCKEFKTFKTYQIFCDAEGSEKIGYMPTMIRTATWNRSEDRKNSCEGWPNVKIKFFKFLPYTQSLQDLVSKVQKKLDTPLIRHFGLPELRNFGHLEDGGPGRLSIESYSGDQTIQRSFSLGEGPGFVDIFEDFDNVIAECGVEDEQKNWLERYELEWSAFAKSNSFYWDGNKTDI